MTHDDLRTSAGRVAAWHDAGLATPLLLAAREFERSLDAFPLEFGAILADHVVVSGTNPFASLAVDAADVRRACEVQARSHLLHLREGFLETRGRGDALSDLIVQSAPAFAALVASIARLDGHARRRSRCRGAARRTHPGPARRSDRGHQARRRPGNHVGRGRTPVPAVSRCRRAPGAATSTAGALGERARADGSGLRAAAPLAALRPQPSALSLAVCSLALASSRRAAHASASSLPAGAHASRSTTSRT